MILNEVIGERVKNIRETQNMSVSAFAKLINEKDHRIRDIENGKQKIPPEIITKLRNILNINPDWLLTGEGEMYKTNINGISNSIIANGNNHQIIGNVIGGNEELSQICEALKKLSPKKRKYFYHKIMAEIYKEEE